MLIGYARISTADQNLDHLHDALHAAECQKIFDDTISGARAERPGLARVFDHLREGRARTNRSQTPPKREPKGQLKRYRGGVAFTELKVTILHEWKSDILRLTDAPDAYAQGESHKAWSNGLPMILTDGRLGICAYLKP